MIHDYIQGLYEQGFYIYCLASFFSGYAISALITIAKRMFETI